MFSEKEKVKEKVRKYIEENFLIGRNPSSLKDSDSLLEQGVIDSTGVLEIVGLLEEIFCLHIEDEDIIPENLGSIDAIVAFVNRKSTQESTEAC